MAAIINIIFIYLFLAVPLYLIRKLFEAIIYEIKIRVNDDGKSKVQNGVL